MVLSILGLFLIILAGLSLSFQYKDRFSRSQRSKIVYRVVSGTAILSTSVNRNDDYMIGRMNISRLSHTLPLWLTM